MYPNWAYQLAYDSVGHLIGTPESSNDKCTGELQQATFDANCVFLRSLAGCNHLATAKMHPNTDWISARGVRPGRAKRGPAARSAAGAEGAPELRDGRKRKLEATKRGATQLLQAKHEAAKRI